MTRGDIKAEQRMEEAVSWADIVSRDADMDDTQRAGLEAWLKADDANAAALEHCLAMDSLLQDFATEGRGQALAAELVGELDERAMHATSPGHAIINRLVHWLSPRVLAGAATVAASLILVALIGFPGDERSAQPSNPVVVASFSTEMGGSVAETLEDGSVVALNTQSRIEVDFNADERGIDLIAGEALFEVAHDQSRPFIVRTETYGVSAVGTAFNVNRAYPDQTVVTVVEGIVEVSSRTGAFIPRRLVAGQQAVLARDNIETIIDLPDAKTVSAWREGRLVFASQPLDEVVQEFARYSPLTVRFTDDNLRRLEISGTFMITDTASFFAAVERLGPVEVTMSDGVWEIRPSQSR